MIDNHETQASSARAVVSQRSVGDLTGLILGNSLEILDRIGRGGMGSVYLARHRDWNLSLAVKSPRPDLLSSDTDKERWLLEAQTWIDLGVHPNIVRCWFIREHRGTPLLFLDYIGGGSLKEALEQRRFGVANWPRILDLAIQACDGLEHAHQSGIVHRDVKPANFLLDDEGRLFVTDFGLVKLQGSAEPSPRERENIKVSDLEQGLTSTGTVLGTPNYCAPEQWLQQDVGFAADLYAMGVVLYEMTTGQLPFEASPGPLGLGHLLSQVLTEEPTPPRRLQPSCPESLEALILQLLAKDPQDRPASAAALRQELVNLYRELTGTPYPRPLPKPVEAVVDVLNNKAVSLYSLGRKKIADETWQQALRLDSLHPDVVYNRGWLLWRQGRYTASEATQSLRQVTSTYPRGSLHCGLAFLWGGDMESAVSHLSEAVHQAEAQADSSAWRHYGDALLGSERYPEAEQAYSQALSLNPNDQTARTHLEMAQGKSRRRQGRCFFPRLQPLLHMKRPHRLTQVTPAGSGWLWLGPEHMELLPADARTRSWSLFHDVGLRKVAVSPAAGRIVALESLPAGIWDLSNGNALTTLENGERYYCISPDGRHGVAGLVELHLVDLQSGETTGRTLRGHEKQVLCALFCGDREALLTGSCDRTARLWSLERGQCLQTLSGHRDFVTCLAYSAETGLALTGSQDGTARTWRLDTGECFRVLEEGGAPVTSVAFARQGQFAVIQTHPNDSEPWTSVWDLRSGESNRRFPGLSRVSPDGAFIVIARHVEERNFLEIREIATGCLRRSLVVEDGVVSDLCFSADGRFFACVTHSGSFYLFEFDESFRVFPQELLLTYTRGGADLEQSRRHFSQLLQAAEERYAEREFAQSLQELQKARQVPGYRRDPQARALTRKLTQHLSRGGLQSCWEVRLLSAAGGVGESPIVLLPGDRLLTANDKILRLWDAQQGNCIRGFPGHTETIRAIALSEDFSRAVSGSLDRGVRCWNLETGECLRRVAASRGGVTALYWVPNTAQVVALTNQYVICGLDFAGLQETFQHPVTGSSWMLGFGEQVWTGGAVDPGRLQIFHALTGKLLRSGNHWRLSAEAGDGSALLASAAALYQPEQGSMQGITASPDGRIHLWDLSEGRHLAVLIQAGSRVTHLALSADGLCLAAGLETGWVQIWDLEHRTLCQVLEGPWGRLAGLALAPDGCELFILGSDRVLRVWEMEWELTEAGARRQLLHAAPKESLFTRLLRGFRRG